MIKSVGTWLAQRNRLTLMAGVAGAAILVTGTTGTLGGFSASIQNQGDTVQTGSLLMQEQVTPSGGTTTTCLSTAGGATITTNQNTTCGANKFGAMTNAVPGSTSYSTVVIQNQGSVAANSFKLSTGSCTATGTAPSGATATNVGSDTSGYCGKLDVTIEDDTGTATCIYPAGSGTCGTPTNSNTLATLASAYASTALSLTAPVAAGASRTYKVTVLVDSTATNADQAMLANLPITFTFGS